MSQEENIFKPSTEFLLTPLGKDLKFSSSRRIFETKNIRYYPAIDENNNPVQVVAWGEDNLFPNKIRQAIQKSSVALDCLDFKESVTYGSGIKYGTYNESGDFIDQTDKGVFPEVDTFFNNNGKLANYLGETVNNIHNWGFATPALSLNRAKEPQDKRIIGLTAKDVFFCRFQEVAANGSYIEKAYYQDWETGTLRARNGLKTSFSLQHAIPLKILKQNNPLFHLEQLTGREKSKQEFASGTRMRAVSEKGVYEYGMLLNKASTGNTYYPYIPHYSVFENGWLDISSDIPLYKLKKMKNTLQVAYKVSFVNNYWDQRFAEQGLKTVKEQKEFHRKEMENIKNFLHGVENAGKTLTDKFSYSPDGKPEHRIIIEKIERDVEKGEYLEDSQEANSMIFSAFGVNPNLRGGVPGKSTSNFNGTDKRELLRIAQTLEKNRRDQILQPLYLIKQYNKWPERLVFTIQDIILTTLDQGREVQEITQV